MLKKPTRFISPRTPSRQEQLAKALGSRQAVRPTLGGSRIVKPQSPSAYREALTPPWRRRSVEAGYEPAPVLGAAPVSPPHPGGPFQSLLIFDRRHDGDSAFTSPEYDEFLGSPDDFEVFLVLDGPKGSPVVSIHLQHSPDGVNWLNQPPFWMLDFAFSANTVRHFTTSGMALSSALRRIGVTMSGGSARVRLWVTSRGIAARRFSEVVLDRTMSAGSAVLSDEGLSLLLGGADKLQIFAVVAVTSGTSPTLTVQIEESPDGITWRNKQTTPEISGAVLTSAATNFVVGEDDGSVPFSAFVRLRVQLGGSGVQANVRIYVTGRGQ